MFSWNVEKLKMFGGHQLTLLDQGRLLSIKFKFGAEVLIRRHARSQDDDRDVSYLNIYVYNEDGFSKTSTGLIGKT